MLLIDTHFPYMEILRGFFEFLFASCRLYIIALVRHNVAGHRAQGTDDFRFDDLVCLSKEGNPERCVVH